MKDVSDVGNSIFIHAIKSNADILSKIIENLDVNSIISLKKTSKVLNKEINKFLKKHMQLKGKASDNLFLEELCEDLDGRVAEPGFADNIISQILTGESKIKLLECLRTIEKLNGGNKHFSPADNYDDKKEVDELKALLNYIKPVLERDELLSDEKLDEELDDGPTREELLSNLLVNKEFLRTLKSLMEKTLSLLDKSVEAKKNLPKLIDKNTKLARNYRFFRQDRSARPYELVFGVIGGLCVLTMFLIMMINFLSNIIAKRGVIPNVPGLSPGLMAGGFAGMLIACFRQIANGIQSCVTQNKIGKLNRTRDLEEGERQPLLPKKNAGRGGDEKSPLLIKDEDPGKGEEFPSSSEEEEEEECAFKP